MEDLGAAVDFIVVGSGCAGAQAAQTLSEAGAQVLLLDVGNQNTNGDFSPPAASFDEIRKNDRDQSRYFLGKNFEGTVLSRDQKSAAFTPDRQYIVQGTDEYIPVSAKKFFAVESLALGGLGNAWGLGCHVFSKNELAELALDPTQMHQAYTKVCERIGISAPSHDVFPYMADEVSGFQPELEVDDNAKAVLRQFQKKKSQLKSQGLFVGKPALALLTQDKEGRSATQYRDMDFWDDLGKSAYRPRFTIEALRKNKSFSYRPHMLVLGFREKTDGVEVVCCNLVTQEQVVFRAQRLLLAGGALSSARIVLRSLGEPETRLPFVTNPFTYLACLQPGMLGKLPSSHKTSLAQLVLFFDPELQNFNSAMCAFFSHKSLLLNKLAKESPMSFRDSLDILKRVQSAFSVVTVNHAEYPSPQKYVMLKEDSSSFTGDHLHIHYTRSVTELALIDRTERRIKRMLASLGCYAFQRQRRPEGSSIHYAGTLPLNNGAKEMAFTTQSDGRLSQTNRVFVADSSAFRYLPAKGPTFSIMAYAHTIALRALEGKL